MHTDAVNHAPAQIMMNTGSQQFGRPSLGAWTLCGLGTESENLPGYVVLSSANGTSGGAGNWGCGCRRFTRDSVSQQRRSGVVSFQPKGFDDDTQRASLDALKKLNQLALADYHDPETLARIQSYEMAYRMQSSAPELMDFSKEPKRVLEMCGVDPAKLGLARNCLLARRLIERGVRFVQLFHEAWDQHGDLKGGLT